MAVNTNPLNNYVQTADEVGQLWGGYHFFRAGYDPILQARHFADVAKWLSGSEDGPELGLCVDVEGRSLDGLQTQIP